MSIRSGIQYTLLSGEAAVEALEANAHRVEAVICKRWTGFGHMCRPSCICAFLFVGDHDKGSLTLQAVFLTTFEKHALYATGEYNS